MVTQRRLPGQEAVTPTRAAPCGWAGGEGDEEALVTRLETRDELWRQLEACPRDEQAIARLVRLQAELNEAGGFTWLARELCRHDRRAWKPACRALHGRLGLAREAVELLLEVHQADPGNAEVCCYLAKFQPNQATRWYEQALRADPSCTRALLAVADAHRKAERFEEAARLYKIAQQRSHLGARSLYRLGEALVRSGHRSEGREYLLQVLQETDTACHVHAAVTLALSHVLDQQHDWALEHCQRAEELHALLQHSSQQELKLARTLKGVVHLRLGSVNEAAETLSGASLQESGQTGSAQWCWDEVIQLTLGTAETLRSNFAAAERHLEMARRLTGPCPNADVLVGMACLRRAQGDLEMSHNYLDKALGADKNSPMALLHMGYLLLCEQQLDRSIQFLQKCLQQPPGTLAYGAAQKGMAHLYLCVAHHWRRTSPQDRPVGGAELDNVAQGHFQKAHSLQPFLRQGLASLRSGTTCAGSPPCDAHGADAAGCLTTGSPPRMGTVDLTLKQANVVLLYAEASGLVPPGLPKAAATPRATAEGDDTPRKVKLAFATSPAVPTLAGTSSTVAPSSPGPSRDASDPALLHGGGTTAAGGSLGSTCMGVTCLSDAATALALSTRLPPGKLLELPDVELGECISCGKFAVVHRGSLHGREVVVKALHSGAGRDGGSEAAAELLAEICVIAELRHPRIVTFVGACLEPLRIALVTELAPGGNLHQALHVRRRRLSRSESFRLALELLDGVAYLHAQQPIIAHLDLKSMNLVLDAEGQHLQICDFGLARAICGCAGGSGVSVDPRERPPSRAGSPRYMAPECYDSNLGAITEKADVWSSGCVLIEIFGARLPYAECGNVQQILKTMLVQHCGPCIPSSIEAPVHGIAAAMLAFEASQRPAIAQALAQLQAAGAAGRREAFSQLQTTAARPRGTGEAWLHGAQASRFLWVSP